jgi:type II secretory pathway predicted ATPase ExeA
MYEAFYKFQGKPFRLTPDPSMLFPSKGHKRAMSYLMYGFEQGEGFVMVTGAVGTGKTLLIQKLFEDLAHRNVTVANIASANLDSEDVLPAIASELNLPFEGRSKEALLHDLKQHLVARSARHSRTLLVVDEAQTLTPAALEMLRILTNLEQRGRALLQVFLVGQSDLREIIVANRMEQLRQRIIATFRLEPMEPEESREYILHRLHAVGWKDDP